MKLVCTAEIQVCIKPVNVKNVTFKTLAINKKIHMQF